MAVWRGNAMRVVEVRPERAVVELPAHPGLYIPHGYIHAGAMLALADTAATLVADVAIPHPRRTLMAAATRVTDGGGRLGLINSTHYVRPRPA